MPPPEFDESAGMQAYGRVVWPMCVRSGGRGHRMEDCLGRSRFRTEALVRQLPGGREDEPDGTGLPDREGRLIEYVAEHGQDEC